MQTEYILNSLPCQQHTVFSSGTYFAHVIQRTNHIQSLAELDNDHSFESAVFELEIIKNIQDSGPWGPRLRTTALQSTMQTAYILYILPRFQENQMKVKWRGFNLLWGKYIAFECHRVTIPKKNVIHLPSKPQQGLHHLQCMTVAALMTYLQRLRTWTSACTHRQSQETVPVSTSHIITKDPVLKYIIDQIAG